MEIFLELMFVMLIVMLVLDTRVMMRMVTVMMMMILQVAKIHAENAIRQKNQSLNFLRMSAR